MFSRLSLSYWPTRPPNLHSVYSVESEVIMDHLPDKADWEKRQTTQHNMRNMKGVLGTSYDMLSASNQHKHMEDYL